MRRLTLKKQVTGCNERTGQCTASGEPRRSPISPAETFYIRSNLKGQKKSCLLRALQAFGIIVALIDGGPSNSTRSAVSYVHNFSIQQTRVGFGNAIAVTPFIICVFNAVLRSTSGFYAPKGGR
jgi:hypothetical protein